MAFWVKLISTYSPPRQISCVYARNGTARVARCSSTGIPWLSSLLRGRQSHSKLQVLCQNNPCPRWLILIVSASQADQIGMAKYGNTTNPVMRAWFRTRERGPGGTHANHENSQLDRAPKHLNSALPKNYFRQKIHSLPVWRGHSCPQAAKLVPDTRKPELSSQLHATQYPAPSQKLEARSQKL